jgi:hypothetical protein
VYGAVCGAHPWKRPRRRSVDDLLWTVTGHGLVFEEKPSRPRFPCLDGRPSTFSVEEVEAAAEMRERGHTWEFIARVLKRDPSAIRRRMKRER